jgi:hypothetical protein
MEYIKVKRNLMQRNSGDNTICNYKVDINSALEKLEIKLDGIPPRTNNQPPRPVLGFASKLISDPATPPSKGGEMFLA